MTFKNMLKWIEAPVLALAITAQSLMWYAERPVTASSIEMPKKVYHSKNSQIPMNMSVMIRNSIYNQKTMYVGKEPMSYIYPEERKYVLKDASCADKLYDLVMDENFPKEYESVFPELNSANDIYPECTFCFAQMYSPEYAYNLGILCEDF